MHSFSAYVLATISIRVKIPKEERKQWKEDEFLAHVLEALAVRDWLIPLLWAWAWDVMEEDMTGEQLSYGTQGWERRKIEQENSSAYDIQK